MKRNLYLVILFIITKLTTVYGQILFNKAEIEIANTAKYANYLSEEEKNVIFYMNLARLNGKKFYYSFIKDFINRYNKIYVPRITFSNPYLISLRKELYKIKNLKLYEPDSLLSLAAKFHANDMGKAGKTGHNSIDGTRCFDRIRRFVPKIGISGENCAYGLDSALDIVCNLLIDNGIKSLGHRKNILNDIYNKVGIGIAPHKTYKYNCVIDFSELKK